MMKLDWNTGKPPGHGYYLAAWRRGSRWTVSELWYNPDSGWWAGRGYMGAYISQGVTLRPIPVTAWMPMPEYTPSQPQSPCAYCRGARCPCTCTTDCGAREDKDLVLYGHNCPRAPQEELADD